MYFEYVTNFVDHGQVSLLIKHPDSARDELLRFENLDDMEICAGLRSYIPLSIWIELSEMLFETLAVHNPKHIF
jgi:hypothetical protein